MSTIFPLSMTIVELLKLAFILILFGIAFLSLLSVDTNFSKFSLHIPLYMLYGVSFATLIFFMLLFIRFNKFILLISLSGVIFVVLTKIKIEKIHNPIRFSIPLLIIILSSIIFIRLALIFEVAPPIDPLSHGTFSALLIYHQKFPDTFEPIGDLNFSLWNYPLGFHIITTMGCYLNDTPPIRTMLILATIIVAMTPVFLYTITYLKTKSPLLGIIAFLLPFITPSRSVPIWFPGFDLLISSFTLGAYPNLMGNFLYVGLLATLYVYQKETNRNIGILLGALLISIFITYYPVFILSVISLSIFYLINGKSKHKKLFLIILAVFFYFIIAPLVRDRFIQIGYDPIFVYNVYARYKLLSQTSAYWIYFIMLLAGLLAGLYLLIEKVDVIIPAFTLPVVSFLLLGTNKSVYINHLWFLYLERILPIGVVLSNLSTLYLINHLFSKIKEKINFYNKTVDSSLKVVLLMFIILMIPILFQPYLEYYPNKSWVQDLRPKGDYYLGLQWIAQNTNPDDLILNDPGLPGLFIPTFRSQAVVNDRERLRMLNLFGRLKGTTYETMINEANQIFQKPEEYKIMPEIINKYGIKYLFLANIPPDLRGKGSIARGVNYGIKMPYKKNTYTANEYQAIFDSNPYLTPVYNNPSVVIYKVNISALSSQMN